MILTVLVTCASECMCVVFLCVVTFACAPVLMPVRDVRVSVCICSISWSGLCPHAGC